MTTFFNYTTPHSYLILPSSHIQRDYINPLDHTISNSYSTFPSKNAESSHSVLLAAFALVTIACLGARWLKTEHGSYQPTILKLLIVKNHTERLYRSDWLKYTEAKNDKNTHPDIMEKLEQKLIAIETVAAQLQTDWDKVYKSLSPKEITVYSQLAGHFIATHESISDSLEGNESGEETGKTLINGIITDLA